MTTLLAAAAFVLAALALRGAVLVALRRAAAWEDARVAELRDRQWAVAEARWRGPVTRT